MNRIFINIVISIIFLLGMLSTETQAKNEKIHICHKGKVIVVSINALQAHLDHGDEEADEIRPGVWVCPDPNRAPDPDPCEPGLQPPDYCELDESGCFWIPCCTDPWTGLPCGCWDEFGERMPCVPPGEPGVTTCWNSVSLQWEYCCRDKKGNTYPCLPEPE